MNSAKKGHSSRAAPRKHRLAWLIAGQLALMGGTFTKAHAREFFNPALLELDSVQGASDIDLTMFEEQGTQPPGTYHVDIYVNNDMVDTRDVEFQLKKTADGPERLEPCLSVKQLSEMGVKTDHFPALGSAEEQCANLSAIPQASADFRFSSQQLLLSFPQASVSKQPRGYVSKTQWDEGITALLMNYSISGSNTYAGTANTSDSNNQYANLRPGINIGPWRLRNYSTWNRDSEGQQQWKSVYTYAQRAIAPLDASLTLGDSNSPSEIFDGVPFRGAQIASDDEMLPDSMRGYAPVVRGIARTNAEVIIRQDGYTIYQSYVSPGAFEINDMYPTGGNGDLDVTIKEADGSEQHLIVPYASLPVLQREGRLKYSLTYGQYRAYDDSVDKVMFGQGTAMYGLPSGFTLYTGGQFAEKYQSAALGVGKNIGEMGALSVDLTQAWSTPKNTEEQSGQSWRIRYSKNIVRTGTNFAIAGYRYSTKGFYSLNEILDTWRDSSAPLNDQRRRNRTEFTMNQELGEVAGSLAVSWMSEDYWNSNRTMRSIGASYNNSWNGISYGLNYSYNINSQDTGSGKTYERDQILGFNITVPFSRFEHNTNATYGISSSKKGNTSQNLGINGTLLDDDNLSWSAQETYGNKGVGYGGNLSTDYRGAYGEVNAGYAWDNSSKRLNYGLQGGIIAHENGITFGQPLGETVALVKAPGAAGVNISNQTGVKTDWRGYAIVPYSSPYRKNMVQLNTETLPENVDLTLTTQAVVPTRGAVVRANFEANVGYRILMSLLRANGSVVPFGAVVNDPQQKTAQGFLVGDAGQVYLTGMADSGTLQVKWGADDEQSCTVSYRLDQQNSQDTAVKIMTGKCL
ncbi:fimbria/pilus outer membrane usher protein [Dryocola clanedunensis]